MEEDERCRSRSPARRGSRVQQVVGTIIRRTRESLSRERLLGDGRSQRSNSLTNQNFQARLTVQLTRDPVLDSNCGHGFTLTPNAPLLVRDVATGTPADGILFPGDQVLQINDTVVEELSVEHVEGILRNLEDSVTMTILRHMTNPKSSIMSAETRARLRSNPVKVRFAEEVVVNGHTQGNSLLFLPNVMKVYLENGQTKAFKFDHTTTVKDIILTLKDKLSIRAIEYFALVLEQQYSITKLLLLQEDDLIQKVVQKKDSHDYRCLFRVSFIPRDPTDLLQDDPSAFEYLFHQSVGDVLQERFAVEMKCNTALRLAALHMHERLDSCGQTRTSIKSITKEFGLDSFISPTLLSNMREKDLRKAISYHLKKIQALLEPRQKVISATQARLAYLTQLGELISYGGRSYTATMMLQDREALISLLVGAKYGLSQIINHKLNMISTLVEFSSISRVELLSESEKVSLLRISLHDMKPFALLMDSLAAKDLACLLGGYCKLLVEPAVNVFRPGRPKVRVHRIPAEEGYVSRCCSDSDDSSDEDYPMEGQSSKQPDPASQDWEERRRAEEQKSREEEKKEREVNEGKQEVRIIVMSEGQEEGDQEEGATGKAKVNPGALDQEMGPQSTWYHTDPRVTTSFSSLSSGSISAALEEGSSAAKAPSRLRGQRAVEGLSALDVHHPYLMDPQSQTEGTGQVSARALRPANLNYRGNDNSCLCYDELSKGDFLPSPSGATTDDDDDDDDEEEDEESEGAGQLRRISRIPSCKDLRLIDNILFQKSPNKKTKKKIPPKVPVRTSSIPGNKTSKQVEQRLSKDEECRFLTPSPNLKPGLGVKEVSESEDEFFDAQDRFTSPVPDLSESEMADRKNANRRSGNWNGSVMVKETSLPHTKRPSSSKSKPEGTIHKAPPETLPKQPSSPRSSQKADVKVKPPLAPKPQLLPKPQNIPPRSPQHGRSYAHCNGEASGRLSSELLEMEPDTMEFKSVTSGGLPLSSPLVTAVWRSQQTQPILSNPTRQKGKTQENSVKLDNQPILDNQQMQGNKSCLVSKDNGHVPDENGTSKVGGKTNGLVPSRDAQGPAKGGDHLAKKKQPTLPPISFSNLKQPPPVSPKPTSPIDRCPLSLPASTPVSPSDPMKVFKDGITLPNGIHPWNNRNGSVQSAPRRVSLSHESLSPKNTDAPLSLTTSLTLSSSKEMGVLEGREPGRSGSGSDLRTSSSSLGGRLPASALRGRIQALPWYMTRSQEILGTLDYPSTTSINGDTSGFGSGLSVASGSSDLNKTPVKDKETAALKTTGKGKDLEEGAEVVIATIKEAEQVSSILRRAIETNGSHQNVTFKDNVSHSDSVSSEQPQSRPHSGVGLGGVPSIPIGGDSPSSSMAEGSSPQQSKEACGCRTVYANCFSGDTEEGVGFDEELTIYEFSRRTRPKPARPPAAPLPTSTAPSPNPTILSLLKDNPRPLSTFSTASAELSPLISRPVSPTLGFSGPLRSLSNKRYGGLKGGFASLRQDIDHLLLVLERGTVDWAQQIPSMDSTQDQTAKQVDSEGNNITTPIPNCPGQGNAFMSEAERSLLQAEARRLATGCQRATRVGWAPDEALRSLSNSFSALVQLSAACLRTHPCPGCDVCRNGGFAAYMKEESEETMDKLKEIVSLYREFVGDVETAGTSVGVGARSGLTGSGLGQGDGEGVRLLAKRCTVLISSVFALTQLFRTRSPDTTEAPGRAPLNF